MFQLLRQDVCIATRYFIKMSQSGLSLETSVGACLQLQVCNCNCSPGKLAGHLVQMPAPGSACAGRAMQWNSDIEH
jgi:hypothetical protein